MVNRVYFAVPYYLLKYDLYGKGYEQTVVCTDVQVDIINYLVS